MGLDMFFSAKRYLSEWDDEDKEVITKMNSLSEGITSEWETKEVVYQVGYWRKANAIHHWFVQNVQNNVDDCQEHCVSYENIIKLYVTVCEVLEDHSKAEDLLPTESGFFFGSIDFDDWYFQDLEYTKKILKPLVEKINGEGRELAPYDFYYRSSW